MPYTSLRSEHETLLSTYLYARIWRITLHTALCISVYCTDVTIMQPEMRSTYSVLIVLHTFPICSTNGDQQRKFMYLLCIALVSHLLIRFWFDLILFWRPKDRSFKLRRISLFLAVKISAEWCIRNFAIGVRIRRWTFSRSIFVNGSILKAYISERIANTFSVLILFFPRTPNSHVKGSGRIPIFLEVYLDLSDVDVTYAMSYMQLMEPHENEENDQWHDLLRKITT